MPFPNVPPILTNANWQSEKGKLAKLFARETGIGAQMNKLNAEVAKVDLNKANVHQAYKTMDDLEAAIKACKSELSKTEAIRKEAYALRDLAKNVAIELKKNVLLKSSAAHVGSIAAAADAYGVSVKSYDPSAEFEKVKANLRNTQAIQKKILKDGLAACQVALAKVKSTKPTAWPDDAWQKFRTYAASVARSPELNAIHAEWKTLSSLGPDKIKSTDDAAKHVAALEKLLAKTGPLVG